MGCCGHGAQPVAGLVVATALAGVGTLGMVKVEYTGDNQRAQFGAVTGNYYPFQTQRVLWVDIRDRNRLIEVQDVSG